MKVVFPNPDSPATYSLLVNQSHDGLVEFDFEFADAYHNSKGSSSLCDNLVTLVG